MHDAKLCEACIESGHHVTDVASTWVVYIVRDARQFSRLARSIATVLKTRMGCVVLEQTPVNDCGLCLKADATRTECRKHAHIEDHKIAPSGTFDVYATRLVKGAAAWPPCPSCGAANGHEEAPYAAPAVAPRLYRAYSRFASNGRLPTYVTETVYTVKV